MNKVQVLKQKSDRAYKNYRLALRGVTISIGTILDWKDDIYKSSGMQKNNISFNELDAQLRAWAEKGNDNEN